MSLVIYDHEQGSPEWHEARRGIITASVVGQLITPKTVKVASNDKTRGIAFQLIAERITEYVEPSFASFDMEEGHVNEPVARDIYSEHFAPAVEVGFMVRDDWGFRIGYSPDGVVGDDGLVEIKSRRAKKHLATILADEVPSENLAQCQTGLMVSGRKWLDYVSYCGGMPLWRKRVFPDPLWFHAITEAAAAFEESATTMTAAYHAATLGLPATERIEDAEEMEI
jgi:predicted phage-related endonuclease